MVLKVWEHTCVGGGENAIRSPHAPCNVTFQVLPKMVSSIDQECQASYGS